MTKMNRESMKDWSEALKNCVEIIAIIIAAWWTYHLFIQKDAPGLEARGSATGQISWYQPKSGLPGEVEVEIGVALENKGTTSFDISRIHVRAWEFDIGPHEGGFIYFDPEKIQQNAPFFDHTYSLNAASALPFPAHYPPGYSFNNSFTWLMKPDCKKWIYFAAEFYERGKEDAPTWATYSWDGECHDEQLFKEGSDEQEHSDSSISKMK